MRIGISKCSSHSYLINCESLSVTILLQRRIWELSLTRTSNFTNKQLQLLPKPIGQSVNVLNIFIIKTLPLLYKTLVRLILEYANAIRGPYYITDQKLLDKSYQTCTFFKGTTLCWVFITSAIAITLVLEERSEVIWYLCFRYWMVYLMLIHLFTFFQPTRGHNFNNIFIKMLNFTIKNN